MKPLPMADKSCGQCDACCTVMGVKEVDKEPYVKCKHNIVMGCSIYSERPPSCSAYQCMWLISTKMSEEHRPDKLGIVFNMGGDTDTVPYPFIYGYEVHPGAIEANENFLRQLSSNILVVVFRYKSRKVSLSGPAHFCEHFVKAVQLGQIAFS